jgi:hypothetical protein
LLLTRRESAPVQLEAGVLAKMVAQVPSPMVVARVLKAANDDDDEEEERGGNN